MKRAIVYTLLFASAGVVAGCEELIRTERKLSSFEVTLFSPVGTPEARCILAGTPTTGLDLSGCPRYFRDPSGATIIEVELEARAIDNFGDLYEEYNSLATLSVKPGKVEPGYRRVRFSNGVTETGDNRPSVAFRGSFNDTFIWITDDQPPARDSAILGLGSECRSDSVDVCAPVGLTCVNTTPAVGYDPEGLAYCTRACSDANPCGAGYFCSTNVVAYGDAAQDVSDGACVRTQPTYAAGAGGPIHLKLPTLTDVNRSDSLIQSPFSSEFVEVKTGRLIVTAVRIDGFYVTDVEGTEFNHLFVFNFSRPDDLFPGDLLISVAGPITEFTGLTELAFPSWEVDYANSPQPIPAPIDLHQRVIDVFPALVAEGGPCVFQGVAPESLQLLDCNAAMERLEAARVSVDVATVKPIVRGSRDEMDLERYGQWRVTVETGRRSDKEIALITRENIPFFDPRNLPANARLGTVTGNLRTVAFNDDDDPLWVVEPREQTDCPACRNP
ncbi:hypothetical protein L6R52_04740 [Myxococcota bacterium]|nr:hypothetical protein [Myxococcota bacterium]